jgi:hypothetical protein
VGQTGQGRLSGHGTGYQTKYDAIHGAMMNFRKRIDEANKIADALLVQIQEDAKARSPNDEISRLNFEIGMLHANIRNLILDLELSKDEVP